MQIITTIVPIFIIISIGWGARKKGFIPAEFLAPANRLTYYLAIPAMIFRAISKGSIIGRLNGTGLSITLGSAAAAYAIAWAISRNRRMPGPRAASFIQSAGHGNQAYIGLAVAYYFLGEAGLIQASILAGFLMILQNALSVFFLQTQAVKGDFADRFQKVWGKLYGNPIILSAMAGIVFSMLRIPLPQAFQRSLDMLAGLAPPMALLLIGASLSMDGMRKHFRPAMGAVCIKLLIMPALGLAFYTRFSLTAGEYLPGLILLASPTATVTYVMAREMKGDAEFAVVTISASTLFSAWTFSLWLTFIQFMNPAG